MLRLVVMAAMLALAAAAAEGEGCLSGCRMTSSSMDVEACGRKESILTTICSGLCNSTDDVYISWRPPPEQETCNGVWSYEVTHIDGCPEAVTYPVARACDCQVCNPEANTHCGFYSGNKPSCASV
ncbi:gonadotropin subunit beta-1-like isoform 2-T2 [Spinachia spinachia]